MSNIFDFAMQMERDAADYYRDLAKRCEDEGLRSILSRLIAAEQEHERILAAMKAHTSVEAAESDLLSEVKNLFAEMRERAVEYDLDLSTLDLYREAQKYEAKSEEFYRQKAEDVENEAQRKILKRIADEEHQHYMVLQNVIDFVNQPNILLEDAEWHNVEP